MQGQAVSTITDMEFATKLKRLCRIKGISGRKLAAILGDVSRSKTNDWLGGTYVPDLREAFRLANLFGVSVDYLADDSLDEPPRRGDLPEDEHAILDLYRALRLGKVEGLRRLAGQPPEGPILTGPTYAEMKAREEEEERRRRGQAGA